MIPAMIAIFVLGYALIAFEHTLQINKATFAMIMCGVLWTVYTLCNPTLDLHPALLHYLGDTCEILVFLICAMAIVEHIDRYGGFNFITHKITTRHKRRLLWILAIVAFFMSAVLDNMTTTIIMVMMLRRLISDKHQRWLFAGIIVIAANSGGAWSPIGDVTTIMLWMTDHVSSSRLVANLLLPSIVSVIIPVAIAQFWVKTTGEVMAPKSSEQENRLAAEHPHLSLMMLVIGVAGLLFVPIFKTLTGLPPFMGMIISLGCLWLFTEIMIRRLNIDKNLGGRLSQTIRNIDMPTILFFLGILMAVNALQQAGILATLAQWMNTHVHEPFIMTTLIGYLSSIVDNVPLVSACIKMFGGAEALTAMQTLDPQYAQYFVQDGLFWHLLTFTAGVGGSLLIIGSAAGVVAMGIEKIPFFWYCRRITLIAMLGYLAGIALIALEHHLLPSLFGL